MSELVGLQNDFTFHSSPQFIIILVSFCKIRKLFENNN